MGGKQGTWRWSAFGGRLVAALVGVLAFVLLLTARADAFVYWTDSANNSIGRASIEGTGLDDSFISDLPGVCGVTPTR